MILVPKYRNLDQSELREAALVVAIQETNNSRSRSSKKDLAT